MNSIGGLKCGPRCVGYEQRDTSFRKENASLITEWAFASHIRPLLYFSNRGIAPPAPGFKLSALRPRALFTAILFLWRGEERRGEERGSDLIYPTFFYAALTKIVQVGSSDSRRDVTDIVLKI